MTISLLNRLVFLFLCFGVLPSFAQKTITIGEKTDEYIFNTSDLAGLEDPSGKLTFEQVSSAAFENRFTTNKDYYPKNYHQASAYWYRIKVKLPEGLAGNSLFEFYDQTTDAIEAYVPGPGGKYLKSVAGARLHFTERMFEHKNFEFLIPKNASGERLYYFRVKSAQPVNVIVVFRTMGRFIKYGLTEYFTYGLFYGMILIFSFHNLLMFMAVRRRQYLFYVLYILSIGLYELSADGIAFQYIWSDFPKWNHYAYGIALYMISIFSLVFTNELLHVKSKAPLIHKVFKVVIVLRTAFFLVSLFYKPEWFIYKFIEFVPLTLAFFTGMWIWRSGYRPARFFVMAYGFLFVGFTMKVLNVLGYSRFIPGYILYYSLSFCFVLEMVLLSFAIGDQVRLLKKKKDKAQKKIISQMEVNARLKDSINKELEAQVLKRTREVVEKSREVFEKSQIIEDQNAELISINLILQRQAEEISRMNVLLENDNITLKTNIEKVTDARVLSTDMEFDEFSQKYPDRDSCYKFLADLKWEKGYSCVRCGNQTFCNGRIPHNRRCTKCAYEESVLHNTIFENNRIPINKAFYLVYLMYTSKGTISSHKLSEKLGIRQSTCWVYASRVKKVLDSRKRALKGSGNSGWSKILFETVPQ
ncbi:7TM diverse intracellular signaling domain-containing protein [Hufsiella ginkgonis]|uniref:Chromosome partitioning protein ParA n=1 Tax=Hufsiella ginkgonis TaxID=2695274 RepID=A0A7K1XYV0_9SPHI|nr:7TM diverse intracellular signaling domain-containing protein [Hufsiella ginkgonis]MXV16008.1 chromosome partitioning protein ParA [Hufsiella ginkgonis]